MAAADRPFFSVLVPLYDRPQFLRACVASALEAGCPDIEVLLSDDASPRLEEVRRAAEPLLADPRVRFFSQPKNLGWSGNRNFLSSRARGRFLLPIGDDDLLLPGALASLRSWIERDPGADLFGLGYRVIDERGRFRCSRRSPTAFDISLEQPAALRVLVLSDILPFWAFHPFTLCYRREIADSLPYRPEAHIGDDLLFLIECMNAGRRMKVLPELFFSWRKARLPGGAYRNLSAEAASNLKARLGIMRHLAARRDLAPAIAAITGSAEFRERFLLNTVHMALPGERKALLRQVLFGAPRLTERDYAYASSGGAAARARIRLAHLTDYLRVAGPLALLMIAQYALQSAGERLTGGAP